MKDKNGFNFLLRYRTGLKYRKEVMSYLTQRLQVSRQWRCFISMENDLHNLIDGQVSY